MKKFILVLGCAIILCAASCGGDGDSVPDAGGVAPGIGDDVTTDVYWVSSSEGSDDNPGTIDKPFKTITKALVASQDGATYKDIHVVGGDYEEVNGLTITSGIGIYGGYGELTAQNTREKDIENNPTNVQLDKCGIASHELTYGDTVTVDGFNITAPGMVFCIHVSINITNNNIHATLSDEYFIEAIYVLSQHENTTLNANIENNTITVDDNWVKGINTSAKGIGFYSYGAGANASLNLKNNEIYVGNGRGDSYGVFVGQDEAANISFVAAGNTIKTGLAGYTSNPIAMTAFSDDGACITGGSVLIAGNTLIAGDIDQSVKGEFGVVFGVHTTGIAAWGFGEVGHIINNVIVSGENSDYSYGICLGCGNNFMVYNNTIVASKTTGEASPEAIFLYEDSTVQIKNNIICADSGYGIYKYASASILSLTSNLFCDGMSNLIVGFEGEDHFEYESLSDILGTSYADESNLIGDPKFTDMANNDYHILSGSDAIDAGEDLSGLVDDDIDGEERPGGSAYDIGADEY